jgi:hypothetical protein
MRPTSVDGAGAALDALATAVDAGEPFRLVLSDALMPDVDGLRRRSSRERALRGVG